MTSVRVWRGPVVLAIAIVALDQLTKHWALNELADGRDIHVIWTLQFNLAFNSGMAFSAAQGFGPVIAVAATIVIVWLLIALRGMGGKLATFGMGCVIGGAAGNLVDRMFRGDAWLRGAVVDFIDFQWFPIFNIADMAINVGAGALILNAVLTSRRERAALAANPAPDTPTAGTTAEPTDPTTDAATDAATDESAEGTS